jgi:gliding motility-associated-like protein
MRKLSVVKGSACLTLPIFIILILSASIVLAQSRPSSTISSTTNGLCIGCTISNPDNAWDSNPNSFATIGLGLVGLGAYGEITYGYDNPIPTTNAISLFISISGTQISLTPVEIFELFQITLEDESGVDLGTYDHSNLIEVHVIDESENEFRINIINEFASTQQIKIRAGNLLNLSLAGRSVLLYDLKSTPVGLGECTSTLTKPINDIANGYVLATMDSPVELLFSIELDAATMLPGCELLNNEIIVVNTDLLVANSYTLQPLITDVLGDVFTCDILLIINDQDIEAVYSLAPSKNVDQYENNETLATASDANGDIVSTELTQGTMPMGLEFSDDGTISVSDKSLLVAGSYEVTMRTLDEKGGTTDHALTLTMNQQGDFDREAEYTVYTPKPINEYKNDQSLADVSDPDGAIIYSEVAQGTLNSGLKLLNHGKIAVDDYRRLKVGSQSLTILTRDELGGATTHRVTITIDSVSAESLVSTALGLGIQEVNQFRPDPCTLEMTYALYLRNFSSVRMEDLQITNNLAETLPSADMFEVSSIFSPTGLSIQREYDGKSNIQMLSGTDFLEPDESAIIEYTLSIKPGSYQGDYQHSVVAKGQLFDTLQVIGEGFDIGTSNSINQIPDDPAYGIIHVSPSSRFIPEGFSPNGDNVQDYFEIISECEDLTKLSVYNRWGDLVYQNSEYANDWDGKSNIGPDLGRALPDAVYYYLLELSAQNNLQGYVVIKR